MKAIARGIERAKSGVRYDEPGNGCRSQTMQGHVANIGGSPRTMKIRKCFKQRSNRSRLHLGNNVEKG